MSEFFQLSIFVLGLFLIDDVRDPSIYRSSNYMCLEYLWHRKGNVAEICGHLKVAHVQCVVLIWNLSDESNYPGTEKGTLVGLYYFVTGKLVAKIECISVAFTENIIRQEPTTLCLVGNTLLVLLHYLEDKCLLIEIQMDPK